MIISKPRRVLITNELKFKSGFFLSAELIYQSNLKN